MRKATLVLLLAAVLVIGAVPISSGAAPVYTAGEDFMVAGGFEGQTSPDIDYPWIVYHDGVTCPAQISVYNFATGEYVHIVNWDSSIYGFNNPSISGDRLVFGTDTEDSYGSIYFVDLTDPATIAAPIKIADGSDTVGCYGNPAIDGDIVVFRNDADTGGDGGIYAIDVTDLAAGMWLVSADDGLERFGPEIGDGWVVCRVYQSDPINTGNWGYGIEAYDLSAPADPPVTVPYYYIDGDENLTYDGPSTDAGMMVYQAYGYWDYDDDGLGERGWAIMMYDLEGDTETQISGSAASSFNRQHPVINDGLVSWHDLRAGNWEVYVYDLATETETCLVEAVDDLYAGRTTTGDGIVAWHDHRDGDGDDSTADLYAMFPDAIPPTAGDDAYVAKQNTPLAVPAAAGLLLNDTDPEDAPLTAANYSDPVHGMVSVNADGSFLYAPDDGFYGIDTFYYKSDNGTYFDAGLVTITVEQSTATSEGTAGVYRFYNPVSGSHFYTPSIEERNYVLGKYLGVWFYEGFAFTALPAPGTVGIHRFYNTKSGAHFYTPFDDEQASVLAKWPTIFSYDGRSFPVSTTPGAGKIPIYRFYNTKTGAHFYTASAAEADQVIATYPGLFNFEGVGFYAVSSL